MDKIEPVAWAYVNTDGECEQIDYGVSSLSDMAGEPGIIPLYAHPAQHEAGEVERAAKAYAEATGYYVPFHPGLSSVSADKIRTGIRAALAAVKGPNNE